MNGGWVTSPGCLSQQTLIIPGVSFAAILSKGPPALHPFFQSLSKDRLASQLLPEFTPIVRCAHHERDGGLGDGVGELPSYSNGGSTWAIQGTKSRKTSPLISWAMAYSWYSGL